MSSFNTTLIESIEEQIFLQLTENADEFKSSAYLFNNYTKSFTLQDKKLFITVCELLNTKYDNVHKTYKNGMCYLCFYTDKLKLNSGLNKLGIADYDYDYEYNANSAKSMNINHCDIVEYMIHNIEISPKFIFDEYFDGTDTVLHILSKNGKYESIEYVLQNFSVDISVKNKDGLSIIDVAFEDVKFIKKLSNLIIKQQQLEFDNSLFQLESDSKKKNTKLVELNSKLNGDLDNSKKITFFNILFMCLTFMFFSTAVYSF